MYVKKPLKFLSSFISPALLVCIPTLSQAQTVDNANITKIEQLLTNVKAGNPSLASFADQILNNQDLISRLSTNSDVLAYLDKHPEYTAVNGSTAKLNAEIEKSQAEIDKNKDSITKFLDDKTLLNQLAADPESLTAIKDLATTAQEGSSKSLANLLYAQNISVYLNTILTMADISRSMRSTQNFRLLNATSSPSLSISGSPTSEKFTQADGSGSTDINQYSMSYQQRLGRLWTVSADINQYTAKLKQREGIADSRSKINSTGIQTVVKLGAEQGLYGTLGLGYSSNNVKANRSFSIADRYLIDSAADIKIDTYTLNTSLGYTHNFGDKALVSGFAGINADWMRVHPFTEKGIVDINIEKGDLVIPSYNLGIYGEYKDVLGSHIDIDASYQFEHLIRVRQEIERLKKKNKATADVKLNVDDNIQLATLGASFEPFKNAKIRTAYTRQQSTNRQQNIINVGFTYKF